MEKQLRDVNGRFVKMKVLKLKQKRAERMKKKQVERHNLNTEERVYPCQGNRIIDLEFLSEELNCRKCNVGLSLKNVEKEKREGLRSVLSIKCKSCSNIVFVRTGAEHRVHDEAKRFTQTNNQNNVTTNAVLGALHAGLGCTQLNKVLACLDIPTIPPKMYKKYEQEVGLIMEQAATRSCINSAIKEKKLVLEKLDELSKELPEEIRKEFVEEMIVHEESVNFDADENNNTKQLNRIIGNIVNIIVSFDMGWSKRGNGRSYDSLNGYGAIIGFLSGKILDYRTRNRKCRKCDQGHSKDDHDCRKNFQGSAKSMESDLGAELVNRSDILKQVGLNVKVLVGDEDSTTMAAINRENLKNNIKRKVHKLADMNHVKKNLTKKIYNLKLKFKELNKKGMISHIKKCFSYAIAQNKLNAKKLSVAVKSIPDHLFNLHENCTDWCRSKKNKNTAVKSQKFIIKDENLHKELVEIFSTYAGNADKYCIPASSNSNESLNSIISYQMPKNKSYSTTCSADFRVASAVLLKNEGHSYLQNVKQRLGIPISSNTEKFWNAIDRKRLNKSAKANEVPAKKRRMELSKERENLRKKLENKEGVTYGSNVSFKTNEIDVETLILPNEELLSNDNFKIVCFDLETSGRKKNSDILQIAAKIDDDVFSIYIEPSQPIDKGASDVNGLQNVDGTLYLRGEKLKTVPMHEALQAFYEFLKSNCDSCVLVAHNASFDTSFLIREIKNYSMILEFKSIIYGFTDSLKLLRKKFPDRKGKGMFTLSKLSEILTNDSLDTNFHEASYDVIILEKVINASLTLDVLLKNCVRFGTAINKSTIDENINFKINSFGAMKNDLTDYMIKKLASSGLTYTELLQKYESSGKESVIAILSKVENKKPLVTNKKIILGKVIDHFQRVSSSQINCSR